MQKLKQVYHSIINSYAQIFFSDGKLLGMLLVFVTFFNLNAGLSGLIAIVISNGAAYFMGLNKTKIISGYYGFNSLLVGLGLGLYYNFSFAFALVLVFTALLTFFITVVLEGWFAKYNLPYLSLPFLLGIWTVSLAARSYTGLEISEVGVYSYNDIFAWGGRGMLSTHLEVVNSAIPMSIEIYLKSLGAIFFQYNIYAGLVIAVALLINSRISFLLTLVGFYSAYFFYQFIGANLGELSYGFIGFNFILTAIAIGGYFIIPSFWSFLWVVLLTPILSLLITGSSAVLGIFQLSTFALPFNAVVITFLYVLKFRERNFDRPELVSVQSHNPEKNLYAHLNYVARFGNRMHIPMHLPFFGEWTINQSYDGEITHKNEWRHALDFVIEEFGKEYQDEGKRLEDYFCYNKPVLAPADGYVESVLDGIDDNEIGEMDNKNNWGNSIVIKHAEFLYSQMSHIRKGSFQVKKGDFVQQGDVIAYVGNSGRSPYPHLHFQMQSTPFVGSKTMKYPISHYVLNSDNGFEFKTASIPSLNDRVASVESKSSLKKAFALIPGQILEFEFEGESLNQIEEKVHWEVYADFYNNTYLYCPTTKSFAYFKVNRDEIVFTGFQGNKKSVLYHFYLASYRVIFGFYENIELNDDLPLSVTRHYLLRYAQDFVAPFYRFIRPKFSMKYMQMEELFDQNEIELKSTITDELFGKIEDVATNNFKIDHKGIAEWKISRNNKTYSLRRSSNEN